jgi:hypothetical protein
MAAHISQNLVLATHAVPTADRPETVGGEYNSKMSQLRVPGEMGCLPRCLAPVQRVQEPVGSGSQFGSESLGFALREPWCGKQTDTARKQQVIEIAARRDKRYMNR